MTASELKNLGWFREQEGRPGIYVRIKTKNPSNSIHANPYVEGRRRKQIRKATEDACQRRLKMEDKLTVRLIRLSAGTLDAHDNLPSSLKNCVDAIADVLGIKDNDPRVKWEYAQEKCPTGCYGVRIETTVNPRKDASC